MARLAAVQHRRRRIQAAIGGTVALVVLALGTTWLLGGFDNDPAPVTLPDCSWTARAITEGVEDTGLPPSNVPLTGLRTLTIETNLGQIEAMVDISSAFCAAASLEFLSGRNFYDGTRCHKLDTTLYTLTCGSKTGDDTSSPNYQHATEGLPRPALGQASPAPADPAAEGASYYLKGAVVMTNIDVQVIGSQFMIVYADGTALPNEYTQVGTVTFGIEFVEQIAAGGAVDASGAEAAVGNPTQDLTITSMRMTDPATIPTDSASPTSSPTATPSEATPTTSAAS
jgi:peptidyl-prolyl cis-trans isomerase B (cyclophilin B)